MPAAMTPLKTVLVVTSVVAALAREGQHVPELDSVTLLQAQIQEKSALQPTDTDTDIESAGDYNFADSLDCPTKEVAQPKTHTTVAKPATRSATLPEAESGDPPGASTLRAVLELMIIAIVFDGARRWRLQKQDSLEQKPKGAASSPAQDAEAAAEAAWVAMVKAASAADVVNFEKALERNPPVARTDTWGCAPLHFAAAGGSTAIAAELLKRGAEVDVLDASEETALHFAARGGHASICELLLDAGAKIDAVNVQDMTPLVLAGHANQEPVCRLLADRGAGVAGLPDEQLPPLVVSQIVRKVFST